MEEHQRSDAIFACIADGLILLDNRGRVTRINPALQHMLQLSADDLAMLYTAPDEATLPPALATLLSLEPTADGRACDAEIVLPSGSRVILQISFCALQPPAQGELRVVHDVTSERRATEARALFVSQVSHELRTPLQHLLSYVSLINDIGDLPREHYTQYFAEIREEIAHLTRLVDDLNELSRLETRHFSLHLERVRLDELLSNLTHSLSSRAQLKGLTLTVRCLRRPVWAMTDPVRVRQVLENLVENAFKFVPCGGEVRISARRAKGSVIVSIADTGPGISPEALPHIFEQFFQASPDSEQRNSGMGLGLYISREILRALGGEIWVRSRLGAGSTFSFRLPILQD